MRPNVNRRNINRRSTWSSQLGIGAGTLLLPPLALGAVLYSMLAPDEDAVVARPGPRPETTEAAPSPPAEMQAASPPPLAAATMPETQDAARGRGRIPPGGRSPVQVAATPAAVIPPADSEGSTTLPATGLPAAPKRPRRRAAKPPHPRDPFPLKSWLRQIGILPRSNGGSGTRGG